MIKPHLMSLSMQMATAKAAVVLGATEGFARGPLWLCIGRTRSAADLDQLHRDADELETLFSKCPLLQRGAAAQAGMA